MTTDGRSAKKHANKTPVHPRPARESSNGDGCTSQSTVTEGRRPAADGSNDGHNHPSSTSETRKIDIPEPFARALPLRIGSLLSLVANRRPSNCSISSNKEASRKSSLSSQTDASNNNEDCADSDTPMKKRFSFPFILTTPNEMNFSLTSSCGKDISNVPSRKVTTILKPRTEANRPSLRSLPHIGADSSDHTSETNNRFRSLCSDAQLVPDAASLNPVVNNSVVVPARRPTLTQTNAQRPKLDAEGGIRWNEQNESITSSFASIPQHTKVQRDVSFQTPRKITATGQRRMPPNIRNKKPTASTSLTPTFASIGLIKDESPALPLKRKSDTSDSKKYSSLQSCTTRSERAERTAWVTTSTDDGKNKEMDKATTNSTQQFASSAFANESYTTPSQCERTKKVAESTAWANDETNADTDQSIIYSTPDFALKPSPPPLPSLSRNEDTQEPVPSIFLRGFRLRGSDAKNNRTNKNTRRSKGSFS